MLIIIFLGGYMKNNLLFRFGMLASLAFFSSLAANLDEGNYFIKSKHSGECLEIESLENNSKLIQAKCDYTNDMQKFKITNIENSIYYISNLAVGNKSKDNGVHLFNSSTPDEFRLIPNTANSAFNVKSTRSNKLLTLIPYTNEVIQYYDHGSKEQFWKFINEDEDNSDSIPSNALFGKKVVKLVFQPIQSSNNMGDRTEIYDIDGNLIMSKAGWRQQNGYSDQGQVFDLSANPIYIGNIKYFSNGDSGNSLYKVYYDDNTVGIFGDTVCNSSWEGYISQGRLVANDNIDIFLRDNILKLKYKEYPISEDFNLGYLGCPELP
jgi:hypothetical protein